TASSRAQRNRARPAGGRRSKVSRGTLVRGPWNRPQRVQDKALYRLMATRSLRKRFVVCLRNDGYEVSLGRHKIYQVLADADAAKNKQLRVIDESGEDYLYPQKLFAPIELPQSIRRAVQAAV